MAAELGGHHRSDGDRVGPQHVTPTHVEPPIGVEHHATDYVPECASDVDVRERAQVKQTGMHAFTMRDIDEHGMMTVMRQALAFAGDGTAGVHLSLDMDSLDPGEAPGVGTPVRGGLSYREAHLALEIIAARGGMQSIEIVEVNPLLDSSNVTVELAGELILSALGKTIL